jgi:hypothetical protein
MPKSKAKAKRPKRWTPAALMRFAPATPPRTTRDELLARIKTLLDVPDTPKGKGRRS